MYFTQQTGFFGKTDPKQLIQKFGSPLYVYNERILRERCREMATMMDYADFKVNFSPKANSNIRLLKIIREEGLQADAMSPGEIQALLKAGFKPEEIFFIPNNVSAEEIEYAAGLGIITSADSLSQLELMGRCRQGRKVAVRFNPGKGAGHHEKVVTAGKKTKFGVNSDMVGEVKKILNKYGLTLAGINQHIGSLFMDGGTYLEAVRNVLTIADQFDTIEFIDFGGGFGIPYRKQEGQERLDLKKLGADLLAVAAPWAESYEARNRRTSKIRFKVEPGRYVVAESGVLLGTVNSVKKNYDKVFIGTDIGFNVIARPVMYDSHHDIEVYRDGEPLKSGRRRIVTVVGNICESGDIIAKDRSLPPAAEGDLLGIMDAGAYGYSMSSNYNNRARPAEVIVKTDGTPELIRRRDTIDDILKNCI